MLSAIDIQNKQFKKIKIGNGYNVQEVNDFMSDVVKSYQDILRENYELKDKVNMLNENIQYYRAMESTIQNALVLAEKTAQDTKTLAYEKADQIKGDAEYKAEQIIVGAKQELYTLSHKIEELKKQHLSIKVQIRQMLQGQLEIIEQENIGRFVDEVGYEEMPIGTTETREISEQEDMYYTKEFKLLDQ